jgi:cellulose synthase operon protein C
MGQGDAHNGESYAMTEYVRKIVRCLLVLPLVLAAGCGSPEQRAQGYYEKGMELINKNDDLNARLELLNALKYKSDKVEVWRALSGIDQRTKATQSEFLDLRRIVELDPSDLDSRLKLARMMIGGGAADAAIKLLEVANEGDKPNADLHALKALLLSMTKDPAGAFQEAQKALEIDPQNVEAIVLVSATKLSRGDAQGALKLLDSVPVVSRDDPQVALLKVQALARKGDLPGAEGVLRTAVAKNPHHPALRNQLVQLYVAEKHFDQAEGELRAVAEENKTDSKAQLNLVRFLVSYKGAEAGRDHLDNLIKAGGDVFDYQIMLADLDVAQAKTSQAIELLQSLAKTGSTPERKLAAQAKLGGIYVASANFTAAQPIIAEMLQKDARNTDALRLRAAIRIEQGQFDSAIADLREALNDQPKSPQLLMLMALAYERSGKNELAERQYADALKSPNADANVVLRYVAFLQRRGDNTHAEDVLTDIVSRNPRNVQLLTALAQVRLARQNWTGALATADAIASIGEDRGVADQIRAAALAGQNKIDQSISALEAAHKAAPEATQPIVSLVSRYVQTGKTDKAETLLRDMLSKYPTSSQLLILMGQTKLAQNKPDEAMQNYKAAIAEQPKDPAAYSYLSNLYTRQKNYDAALEAIKSGLREQPNNFDLRLAAAGVEFLRGDPEAAIAQYEAILKDQPKSLVAINNLVSLLLDYRSDKESLDRALALSQELKDSSVPAFQDTWGWAEYKRGNFQTAMSILEAAENKLPNAAVRYHLAMSYMATGRSDKASEQLKAAADLEPDGTPLKRMIRSAMK